MCFTTTILLPSWRTLQYWLWLNASMNSIVCQYTEIIRCLRASLTAIAQLFWAYKVLSKYCEHILSSSDIWYMAQNPLHGVTHLNFKICYSISQMISLRLREILTLPQDHVARIWPGAHPSLDSVKALFVTGESWLDHLAALATFGI